ncbi:MAG: hypothetical protein MRECE_2c136 [Mycoplasmataceae bacterium CE_OT135]|nr:MAG: hypothetical protein MRECE_2c136 [Mycoplasmataceae bacterium CE_OT135]
MSVAKKSNKTTKTPSRLQPKRLTAEELQEQQEEQFWEEVDQLSQEKIYQLLTNTLPLPNLKLITESWRYEDKQQSLTGLFLHKDVDYRTLLSDIQTQYAEEELPEKEYLAEEITLHYCQMVIKALLADLSDFACYDASYFEDLTS